MFSFVGNLKLFIMEAKELRIGNYVLDDTTESIMVVHRLESKKYTEWNSGDEYSIVCLQNGTEKTFYEGYFKPIQLTEEILLKCGFEKGSNIIGDCYYIEHDFGVSDFVLNITKTSNFEIYELDLKIDYLHQLQNLYFALTNEELTVNL